jgi:hypothetical protein
MTKLIYVVFGLGILLLLFWIVMSQYAGGGH